MYVFIVDTEDYSGNFEREMCAYMTGCTGECSVGHEQAQDFFNFNSELSEDFDEIIGQVQDEHGTWRPCEIEPTPGWYNTGNGRMIKREEGDTENRFPAYMSVAIYFNEKPTERMIQVMKGRAYEFANNKPECLNPNPIKVTGFRLVERVVTTVDTEIEI